MRRAIFLDRDGVLNQAIVRNRRPFPPKTLAEFQILDGAQEACRDLHQAGFLLIVVTNQPDVARGLQSRQTIETFHRTLRDRIPLDDILACFHDDLDNCPCRKPKPGLIIEAAKRWEINLKRSFVVGDRWRDVDAGRGAGCKTVLIDYDYDEVKPLADYVTISIVDAARWILTQPEEPLPCR
jgi:D-glycero-D-manno-heptose 1,7-bisphosphate phosphatase